MLRNILQLSFRSVHDVKILKTINLKPIIKCRYSRWSSRRPSVIVNKDELFDNTETTQTKPCRHRKQSIQALKTPEQKKYKKNKEEALEKKKYGQNKEAHQSSTKNSMFTALKEDDKIISSLMLKIKTKKLREKNNLMMLEGYRLIKDAMEANIIPKIVFFNRLPDILPLSLPKEVKLYKIPYRTIQLWSNLVTSPGILGIFNIPEIKNNSLANDAIPLTIICDNIREPGNLGTIIRAAAAVGCERLLLMKGCVDLWEPKVLRSAVGAHFRLPISTCLSWNEIPALINEEAQIFLADNNITYENEFETHTVNQESNTDTSIESENSIKFEDSIRPEDKDINEASSDNNINYEDEDDNEKKIDQLLEQTKKNKSTAKTRSLVKKLISQLPVVLYHTLDFTQKETILVIGGETESVSLESCKLLRERNCVRINVPLTNNVDSLNVGVALGIVTFEIKRQFITRNIDDE